MKDAPSECVWKNDTVTRSSSSSSSSSFLTEPKHWKRVPMCVGRCFVVVVVVVVVGRHGDSAPGIFLWHVMNDRTVRMCVGRRFVLDSVVVLRVRLSERLYVHYRENYPGSQMGVVHSSHQNRPHSHGSLHTFVVRCQI